MGTAAALSTVTGGGGEVGFGPTVASGSSATSPSPKVLCESLGHASQYRKNKEGYIVGLGLKKGRQPATHNQILKIKQRIFISIRSKRKMVLEAAALVWLLATLRGRQDFRTLSYSNIQQHQSSADMPSNVHDMRGTEYIHSCSMRCLKSLIKNRVNATRQPNAMLAMLRWKRTRTHPCSGEAGNLAMGLGQARPSWLQ